MSIVDMRHVSWVRKERTILDDVNWRIEPGEHWAIVGLNGSGKTTLLNLINGYIWPTTGEIDVLQRRFGRTDMQDLRRHIGWVSAAMADRITTDQPYESALEVVISGKYASVGLWTNPEPTDANEAFTYMEQMGCSQLAKRSLHQLSQGEKQRTMIARALMAKPQLLILDEPCTGLDVRAREGVLEAVQSFTQHPDGPTILYVTHHTEEIVHGLTHSIVLHHGRVAASGEKHEVITGSNLSAAFEIPVEVNWQAGRAWLHVTH